MKMLRHLQAEDYHKNVYAFCSCSVMKTWVIRLREKKDFSASFFDNGNFSSQALLFF